MGSVFVDTSAHLNKSLFGWFLPLDDNLVSHNLAHCCYGVINLSYQFLLSFRCLSVQVSATTVRQTHASTGSCFDRFHHERNIEHLHSF